ncbi:hypothetical protein [Paracraurococcus ruber]|nr:hypothetical protein [Paracraurococcus ruber]TDG28331.1 hypothetical protein E2C05_20780 [Paracraurococcus ruber]
MLYREMARIAQELACWGLTDVAHRLQALRRPMLHEAKRACRTPAELLCILTLITAEEKRSGLCSKRAGGRHLDGAWQAQPQEWLSGAPNLDPEHRNGTVGLADRVPGPDKPADQSAIAVLHREMGQLAEAMLQARVSSCAVQIGALQAMAPLEAQRTARGRDALRRVEDLLTSVERWNRVSIAE